MAAPVFCHRFRKTEARAEGKKADPAGGAAAGGGGDEIRKAGIEGPGPFFVLIPQKGKTGYFFTGLSCRVPNRPVENNIVLVGSGGKNTRNAAKMQSFFGLDFFQKNPGVIKEFVTGFLL
jgi:hypothetical protein